MKNAFLIAVLLASALFVACSSLPLTVDNETPPPTVPTSSELVGTWRFISFTDGQTDETKRISEPFFMRFYSDGTVASWPTPVAPVTRGLYKLQDGMLTLPDAPAADKCRVRLTHDKMWMWNESDGRCLYYRVEPDLEPGKVR
jgi:hypothetical protein